MPNWVNAQAGHGDMLRFKVVGLGVIIIVCLMAAPAPANAGMLERNGVMKNITREKKARERVCSGFGTRRDPIDKSKNFHKGIDVSGPAGTRVMAYKAGTV